MSIPTSIAQTNIPPGFIDLGLGDPGFSLLPIDMLRGAAADCFARGDTSILQYGAEQGNGSFRQALADFLSRGYGFPVDPAGLFVTAGASGALDLLCTLFTSPGDTIFVEEPSYFLALRIFRDHGLRIVPIPTDTDGLVVEALEASLAEVHPKFLYIIPTFQNPSGQTLPLERREQLVALARQHDFLLVADEVYHFLEYTRQPPVPFATSTGGGNVIALNSFSKILAPGLRLGWLQADGKIIQKLTGCGLLDSGGGMNPFSSAIVREVIESGGLEANIEKLKTVYRSRLAAMGSALRRDLPKAQFAAPAGGYFFWVRLPGVDTSKLQVKADALNVGFRPGARFSSQGGLGEYMRLSFVFYGEEEIEEGVRRLKLCLQIKNTA
jgi:DNA-binding transcriptional MocR family regulator